MPVPALKPAPSTSSTVVATPEPPVSLAVSVTATSWLLQPAGASSLVAGAVVSIRTVAVRSASTLPAPSVERYVIVCTPSGAATVTDAPALHVAAPSILYSVVATPEPPSAAARCTVTGALLQPAGA